MEIEYRDIPGWPGYRATSDGEVQSCLKQAGFGKRWGLSNEWRTLKPSPDTNGYLIVGMQREGKSVSKRIHQVVYEAFHGPRRLGLDTCHNDGNQTNNIPSNLSCKTSKLNHEDRKMHGTTGIGIARGGRVGIKWFLKQLRELNLEP